MPIYMKKGTATDREYYPDSVFYEASYRFGVLLVVKGDAIWAKRFPMRSAPLVLLALTAKP